MTQAQVEAAARAIIDRLDQVEAEWDKHQHDNEGIIVTAGEIRALKIALVATPQPASQWQGKDEEDQIRTMARDLHQKLQGVNCDCDDITRCESGTVICDTLAAIRMFGFMSGCDLGSGY